jgi:ABC-type sugar transport system, permease component
MVYKRTWQEVIFNIFTYTFFALFTLLCVFPFYYIFINSISANDLAATGQILFYPKGIHFNNYLEVFKLKGIGQATFISVARTVIGTISCVLCTAFVAYLLTKNALWGRRFWFRFIVFTMYFNVGLIPWYINMQMLGLTDNFLAYVIGVINPYNLVLTKTFIENIPSSLEESAELDGAGTLTVFLRIILPLSKPILATTAVFTAVMQWNSFMDTVILMNDSRLYTLQFLLWQYLSEASSIAKVLQGSGAASTVDPSRFLSTTSIKMTVSLVVMLPVLFVYPFFQRYFVKGIMLGAVKG